MQLSIPQLKELIAILEDVRRASTVGNGLYCAEPIVIDGETDRLVAKPGTNPFKLVRYGCTVEVIDNVPHIRVPHGVHGRAFFVIDPETKKITCAACAAKGGV